MAVNDNLELLDMAIEESDEGSINQMLEETNSLMSSVEDLEFNRMFSNKMDPSSAFIDIQSGSGGTEAQDWADMLLRMYKDGLKSMIFQFPLLSIHQAKLLELNPHPC